MDLKLIERFLQAMVPPKGNQSVQIAFECMRAHPMTAVPTIGIMLGRLQHSLYAMSEAEAAAACSQVLCGVMLSWCTENEELRKIILEDYLERSAKMRGQNVISFFDKKAGK